MRLHFHPHEIFPFVCLSISGVSYSSASRVVGPCGILLFKFLMTDQWYNNFKAYVCVKYEWQSLGDVNENCACLEGDVPLIPTAQRNILGLR